jgi:hypothetical protein
MPGFARRPASLGRAPLMRSARCTSPWVYVSSPLGGARGARARGARARGPRARASRRSRPRPRSPCRHRRLHRGPLAMAQVNGTGGRRSVHCQRPRPPATGSSRRATAMRRTDAHRTAHRRTTHCALTQSARALRFRRKSHAAPTQLRQENRAIAAVFHAIAADFHAIASEFGRNCVGSRAQLRRVLGAIAARFACESSLTPKSSLTDPSYTKV